MRRNAYFATLFAVASLAAAGQKNAHHPIGNAEFGRVGETNVQIYTLTNVHGIEARIMTYGATLVSLKTPDRAGNLQNIILGFDSLDPYVAGVPYFGATVGRYANRIAGGRFVLDGMSYQLPQNDGPNSLHGGKRGFDKRVWRAQAIETPAGPSLRLTYVSAAGEEGYPGELTAHVTYRLDDNDTLTVDYEATTTAPTPVNLANHAYYNLTGDPERTILQQTLLINADRFTPVNATLIPTGELRAVAGTPFDFRTPHSIGSRINDKDEQLRLGGGYDHNWVLNSNGHRRSQAGGGAGGSQERSIRRNPHDPTGIAVLLRQFPRRQTRRQGHSIQVPNWFVFGDAAFSGLAQPIKLSFDHRAPRPDLFGENASEVPCNAIELVTFGRKPIQPRAMSQDTAARIRLGTMDKSARSP